MRYGPSILVAIGALGFGEKYFQRSWNYDFFEGLAFCVLMFLAVAAAIDMDRRAA
jgi:hypothetical protein